MRGGFLPLTLGWGLTGLGALMLLFAAAALIFSEPIAGFLVAGGVSGLIGALLLRLPRGDREPDRREAIGTVLLLWLVFPLLGSVPYVFDGQFGLLNAFFESMSGFTGTGATVLQDFEALPRTLMFYRSMTQWLGGIGIIVVFIAVFPQLGVAGRQLFNTEMPGPNEDRLTPRLRQTAVALLSVYLALTILCLLGYWLAGMPLYDAVAHALTTVSAGGFSTGSAELAGFGLPLAEVIAIIFMFLAGANFSLQYRALGGRPRELLRDAEFRAYLAVTVVAGGLLMLMLLPGTPLESIRLGLMQAISIISTTGFNSGVEWSAQAQLLLLALMFVGGSAGSAAGSVKVIRWLIVLRSTGKEVQRLLHPRAALPLRVGGRVISVEVLRSITAFFTLYMLVVGLSAIALILLGTDHVTSFSAAMASTSLVGFAFDAQGLPIDFATLPPLGRVVLMFDMYAGRLEIVTVAVLLVPDWWRRWRPGRLGR